MKRIPRRNDEKIKKIEEDITVSRYELAFHAVRRAVQQISHYADYVFHRLGTRGVVVSYSVETRIEEGLPVLQIKITGIQLKEPVWTFIKKLAKARQLRKKLQVEEFEETYSENIIGEPDEVA